MRLFRCFGLFLAISVTGCAPTSEPPKKDSSVNADPKASRAEDDAEQLVRLVISENLKVAQGEIPMDKPISAPPLNADELDLVELVMELEDRKGIVISDDALDRFTGTKFGKGPVQITPNQLVLLVREAPKQQLSKKKRK